MDSNAPFLERVNATSFKIDSNQQGRILQPPMILNNQADVPPLVIHLQTASIERTN
jgi:hypothetical protein